MGIENADLPPHRCPEAVLLPALEAAAGLSSEYNGGLSEMPLPWHLCGQNEGQHLPGLLWGRLGAQLFWVQSLPWPLTYWLCGLEQVLSLQSLGFLVPKMGISVQGS